MVTSFDRQFGTLTKVEVNLPSEPGRVFFILVKMIARVYAS